MLLTGDSSFSHKGRRTCLAIFNSQSIPATSMPEPTLQEPLKSEDALQQSRSTLSSTREESLHQVSLMAGTRVFGPSDAPCLVKSSTAHGDLLLWIMSSSIGVINLSGLSSYDSTAKSKFRLPSILRSKASRTFAILVVRFLCRIPLMSTLTPSCSLMDWSSVLTSEEVTTLTTEGSTLAQPSFPAIVSCPYIHGGAPHSPPKGDTLGFSILGPSHYRGPLRSFWPNVIKSSPSTNLSKPRCVYFIYGPSPLTCFVLHDLSSRRLCLCSEATNRLWLCTCFSQTLLLTFPQAKTFQTLFGKIIDETSLLESRFTVLLLSLSENHVRLSRCVTPDIPLLVINFTVYPLKQLATKSTQRPQPGDVSSLCLLQFSRTVANCSRLTSKAQIRISILPDLEGPRRPSFPVMERTSAPPSSYMERNLTKLLAVPLCLAPVHQAAKYPYSTSRTLLAVTFSKIPELFAEVSLTHHNLVCGMLLLASVSEYMDLSSKIYAYRFLFDASLYCKTLYPFVFPSFGLIE